MNGLILAAGRGSRMGFFTETRPKCMVNLFGRPLFEWQLSALSSADVENICVVRGYKGEAFNKYPQTKCFKNPRWQETNMVFSLAQAATLLENGTTIISYGDIFYPKEAVVELANASGDIVIAFDPNWLQLWSKRFADPLSDAETFRLGADNSIVEIGSNPKTLSEISGQYMGLIKLTLNGWKIIENYINDLIPEDFDNLDFTSLLQRLIDLGVRVFAVAVPGPWGEVDSKSDLILYEKIFELSGNRLSWRR